MLQAAICNSCAFCRAAHDAASCEEFQNFATFGQVKALFQYFQREWLPATKIPLWNIHGVTVRTNNHLEFLQLITDEKGNTEKGWDKWIMAIHRERSPAISYCTPEPLRLLHLCTI
ncbi:hypothetical protein T4D_861 [Trichinella pseudospiralis]|uniref:Uncharacterized protein n=1 Tax=Trichinella pseudospiralis TaxID=6337 RepID=A0A0V1F955_TRIPS|nr:hypothetical protein T4D_861 [Trichinella pseudospiralis]